MRARRKPRIPPTAILNPQDMARAVRSLMREEQETFVAIYLNVKNVMIGEPHVVAIGTVHEVDVSPRDVFREAIRRNACGVVVSHNHPSGDSTPSTEDLALTTRLRAAGTILGIPVVDHVVVTAYGHTSIAEYAQLRTET